MQRDPHPDWCAASPGSAAQLPDPTKAKAQTSSRRTPSVIFSSPDEWNAGLSRVAELDAGLGVRFGKDVNAIGLICDKLIMPSRMLFCQGGGMAVSSGPLKLSILIDFKAAPQSSRAAIPARGECAWQDSPVAPNEPKRLYVPIKNEMKPLVEAAQKGGIFLIHASVQGAAIRVDKIDSVNVGFVPGGP